MFTGLNNFNNRSNITQAVYNNIDCRIAAFNGAGQLSFIMELTQ